MRAEFFNVFNRTYLNNADSTNALATQATGANGQTISGFGRINTGKHVPATPERTDCGAVPVLAALAHPYSSAPLWSRFSALG